MFLNRFDEAEQVYKQAFDNGLDAPEYHWYLHWIAYARNDAAGMQRQIDWLQNGAYVRWGFVIQAQAAALSGRWRRSQELESKAIEILEAKGMKGLVGWVSVRWALTAAAFGDCGSAKAYAAKTLANSPDANFAGYMAVMAQCGDAEQAQTAAKRLSEAYPNDTRYNRIWLPLMKAAIDYQRNEPARAIETLSATARYEGSADFQPQYLRGLCYLKLGQGEAAAAEFRKILERRGQGEVLVSTVFPLARLGLARAAVLMNDEPLARQSYEEFFAGWPDADVDLPILVEAKREFGKLK